ncbi:MAG TPA: PAS domain S-box protein, partial [Chroococcidiopsis sp.]
LRESERKYRHLIDHMNAGFIVHAPDTQVLQCNATACELLGLSMEQLQGKMAIDPAWCFIREDGVTMTPEEYPVNQVLLTQEPLKKYVVGIRKGGDRVAWVLVTAFPEFDSYHRLTQIVVTFIDISDRKSAEIALQNSQARFAGILDIANDAIISVDAEQHITLFNKGAEQIFGYTPAEVLGKPLSLLMPERFAQTHHAHVTQYAQTDSSARPMAERGSIFGRRRDGTEFPAEASISRLTLNGEVTFTTFLRDITERQRGEEALRQSEATTRALIQTIPDLLIRMRSDGTYIDFVANPDFNIFNPSQFYKNVNIYDILDADLAQQRMHYTQQALLTGTVQVCEQVLTISDKQYCEEVRIVPLLHDEVLVMVRDITDRKQVEEDLRQQKEMLQTIVDHIPVMIALFNAQGTVEFINPELQQVLGWSLEDWQQTPVLADDSANPSDRQSVLHHLLTANGIWRDLTILNAAQQQLETSWVAVKLSNGRFLGIGQDISDRKRKESALRQAMEAAEAANLSKSTFLANMSHELRTPLNVILGFAQVMSHDTSLTANQQNDLRSIRQSGDHLLSLINEVLDLSKIEAGHCTIEESGFDLIALLHTLRSMMAERATAKQLQFTLEIEPEVPQFVVADEQKLRQILLNLLSNAIKFTQQGAIALQAKVQPSEGQNFTLNRGNTLEDDAKLTLQFDVVDSGVGIDPAEQSIIFDAFVQAEAGKKSASGTGLGLTISRKLLELMHGHIAVQSCPNQGSTFSVTLPVQPASAVYIQPRQSDRLVIGLVPGQPCPRILVVDDQRENRLVLVRLLTQIGIEVKEAGSGAEAIQIWQEWHPDLTWMDIRMPGMDGYETTKQIRAMEGENSSIIIALTAQASRSDRTLALAAGCNDYISKPFRQETLFFKLKEYLGLEYVYAESTPPSLSESFASGPSHNLSPTMDPAILSELSAEWLNALERAAICGNDRAIANLIVQLPPELSPIAEQLMNFARQFQFEHILTMIHR